MQTSEHSPDSIAPPEPSFDLLKQEYSPSPKDVLAVAWIGTYFECAAVQRGSVVSHIISRENCGSSGAFDAFLDEAVQTLAFCGTKAELLVDSGLLDTSNITLPPIKARLQTAFIREKIRRMETASGALIWEHQRISASKTGQRALVHSLSREAFVELERQFERRNLELKKVLPFMGTASRPFKNVQTPHGAVSIVLAPVGPGYKILALDHSGDLQFARDLNQQSAADPQRVAIEINRCILFTRQQFGMPVSQIVTVGLQAARFKSVIASKLQSDTPIAHQKTKKDLWLSQLAHSNAFNLAKESMMQERKRRIHLSVASLLSLLICGASITYVLQMQRAWKEQGARLEELALLQPDMQAAVAAFDAKSRAIRKIKAFLGETENLRRPPLEKALISFLSNSLPEDTWISEMETNWEPGANAWNLRIVLLCNGDADTLDRREETLRNALSKSPFGLQIPKTVNDRVRAISSRRQSAGAQSFIVEGTIPLYPSFNDG